MAEKNNTKESSQRGENSVLFSLSSLTAVGNNNQAQTPVNNQPASKPAHQPGVTSSDKSGLIDLKTLTALGAGSGGAKPAAGGAQPAANVEPAVPAIFANTRRSSSKTGLIVAVLLVLSLGGVAYYLYDKSVKDAAAAAAEADRIAALAAAEKEALAAEVAQKEADAKAEAERLKKEADEKLAAAEKEIAEAKAETERLNKLMADREAALAAGKSAEELAAMDAEIAAAKDAKDKKDKKPKDGSSKPEDSGKPGDSTKPTDTAAGNPTKKPEDADLLNKYGGGDAPKEAGLADDQIKKVLGAYAGPLKNCRGGQAGDLKVKFTINADGSVSGVSASGSLAGTPVETCATDKFSKMRFPKSDGAKNTSHSLP